MGASSQVPDMRLQLLLIPLALGSSVSAEDFEGLKAGEFERLPAEEGTLVTKKGHAVIHNQHARSGKQSLRLLGGEKHSVELLLGKPAARGTELSFWAERWTSRSPFSFRIEGRTGST